MVGGEDLDIDARLIQADASHTRSALSGASTSA